MVEKTVFSKVGQIGIVVRDMDKAIEYYESLGIGPFYPRSTIVTERKAGGKTVDWKLKAKLAQWGSIEVELVEPVEGESIHKEFLETRGEGINHLGFFVDDIDKETAKLEEKGFKILYSARFQGGGAVYFDTGEFGGILFELIQRPPEYTDPWA